jgi:XTP/dITP diphosphohydrolase
MQVQSKGTDGINPNNPHGYSFMRDLVLATRNPDKITEIQEIMRLDIKLLGIGSFADVPDVIEDGDSLHDNALKKARAAFQASGMPSLADDTGLEVDALNGAPGVFSSRFAGEHATYEENNIKLLSLMKGISKNRRTARFRCVACLVDKNVEHFTEGICEGVILRTVRGQGGFGYDPSFYIPKLKKTLAELSPEEKNRISHRGKAFREMAQWIQNEYSLL